MHTHVVPGIIDLTGAWAFAYAASPGEGATPALLPEAAARGSMPVPGFWDDHLDRLKAGGFSDSFQFNSVHQPIRFAMTGKAPDASLPYLVGVGQYEHRFDAPVDGRVTFECGPTFVEAWLWVNGRCVAHQPHYSTRWSVVLDGFLRPGETNRLSLQVSNARPRTMGCITRGFKGYSAGVAGPVRLRMTGPGRIADCYVQPSGNGGSLRWQVDVDRPGEGPGMNLAWRMVDPETHDAMHEGVQPVMAGMNTWNSDAAGLACWSDRVPKRYRIELMLHVDGGQSDAHEQMFGLRWIEAEGFGLRLNGEPVYLRGATEHAYYPLTCTMPLNKTTYRANLQRMKALGFNWLRFHTWTPPEPYLEAADELGMLLQVEPPRGAGDEQWADILRTCRRHSSVVIYCAGNEELLDEAKLDQLERWAALRRELAPEALFNPHEALRGIEYGWKEEDLGDDVKQEPYLHNPRRLERLKTFSDCIGQFAWGLHSYRSTDSNPTLIDDRLGSYERPCLSHEICIHGSYMDLDLEHRYQGTRIGTQLYAAVREHLRERGLEHRAGEYYVNSCAWMRRLRKHAVEGVRRSQRVAGYDLLGAIDHHWHRTGYPCGIMNEFYEMKPGETAEDVRRYNGASVLLLDHDNRWVCTAGQAWAATLSVSLFEQTAVDAAQVQWCLREEMGQIHEQGAWPVAPLTNGQLSELGTIAFTAPQLAEPAALMLEVRLTSETLQLDNRWPLWVYPSMRAVNQPITADDAVADAWPALREAAASSDDEGEPLRVVSDLSEADGEALARGGRVLLLGAGPFPSQVTVYQIACAGRAEGNMATCIADHPITRRLPHTGFCDWDFQQMIDRGTAVQFDDLDASVEPIVEVVSSFKDARQQAALFELRVGEGRLLVCSLGLKPDDPAAAHLLTACIGYACSEQIAPRQALEPATLKVLMHKRPTRQALVGTDEGFDERVQLKAW